MKCEECELLLAQNEVEVDPAVEAHVAGCRLPIAKGGLAGKRTRAARVG